MSPALFVCTEYSPERLETVASSATNRAHARRLRAIAAILRGASRQEAAAIGGMERQTLRDWVHRFNAEGPDGLVSRKPSGRPAKLSYEQKRELIALLISPAVKERYGVVRWRLADITALVRHRYGVELNEISVGRMLRSLGLVYNGFEWHWAASSGSVRRSS